MREEVFRLITFFFSTACLAAFVWFGLTVDLGSRTLFGHIRAIGGSDEAQDLSKGIQAKVQDFVGIEAAKRAAAEAARKAAEGGGRPSGPPQDEHSDDDREGMRKLTDKPVKVVGKPDKAAARPAPKSQGRATPPSARPPSPVQK